MYDAVFAEGVGTPAVVLCNDGYAGDGRSAAADKGMPGIRLAPENVPCECTETGRIAAGVSAVVEDIVAALTRPLSQEEQSPTPRRSEGHNRVIFKGSWEEVNRFFYKRGWTDGFPIAPPTEEAVQEMLRGTDLPPDHVVGEVVPRLGKATVEKIAINAVMAGALPTYLPILIAGVQALVDPASRFDIWAGSAGSWSPFYIINGPIRNQLHVNCGSGALSPGDIANATIGRAMGLIVKNTAGVRKGIEDMGVLGNPCKYSMVTGENEELSPWEPLHVEHGFDREDNCVTLTFPNSFDQLRPYGTDDQGILRAVISNLMPARRGLTLMLIPTHARILADSGWTKEKIADHIVEQARVPANRHPEFWGCSWPDRQPPPPNGTDEVALFRSPDWIRILVTGGPGAEIGITPGSRIWVTKKVNLPADWENLVKKYKDVIPVHSR